MAGTDLVTSYFHPAEYRANLAAAAAHRDSGPTPAEQMGPGATPINAPGHLPGMPPGRMRSGGAGGGAGAAPGGGGGGVAQTHLAMAAERGKELGEPTSFNGGAGAPEPIAVMRGTTTTYSPGQLPGHQFAEPEHATALQAQQAYNRGMLQKSLADAAGNRGGAIPGADPTTTPGMVGQGGLAEAAEARYGGYRAPGQTMAEIAATKANQDPEKIGKGALYGAMAKDRDAARTGGGNATGAKQNIGEFQRLMAESPHSTYKDGKMSFVPQNEDQARDAMAAENIARDQGGAAGRKHFDERQSARSFLQTQPLPRGFDVNSYLATVGSNPDAWKEFMASVNAPKTAAPAGTTKRQQMEAQATKERDDTFNSWDAGLTDFGKRMQQKEPPGFRD